MHQEIGHFAAIFVGDGRRTQLLPEKAGAGNVLAADPQFFLGGNREPATDGVGHRMNREQDGNGATIDIGATQTDEGDVGVEAGIDGSDDRQVFHGMEKSV